MCVKLVRVEVSKTDNIFLELDEKIAPKTVDALLKSLPFQTKLHVWGEEVYTAPIPIKAQEENAKSLVDLFDVGYWPPGNAICLFYGQTPISEKNQIKPYSAVNVIGKIKNPDKNMLAKIKDGAKATLAPG